MKQIGHPNCVQLFEVTDDALTLTLPPTLTLNLTLTLTLP